MMPNSDPEGQIFLSAPNIHDILLLAYLSNTSVDVNVGVSMNEPCSLTLMSAILKVDVVVDITMTSIPNILTTELRDFLYNQCIDNVLLFVFYPFHGSDKGM